MSLDNKSGTPNCRENSFASRNSINHQQTSSSSSSSSSWSSVSGAHWTRRGYWKTPTCMHLPGRQCFPTPSTSSPIHGHLVCLDERPKSWQIKLLGQKGFFVHFRIHPFWSVPNTSCRVCGSPPESPTWTTDGRKSQNSPGDDSAEEWKSSVTFSGSTFPGVIAGQVFYCHSLCIPWVRWASVAKTRRWSTYVVHYGAGRTGRSSWGKSHEALLLKISESGARSCWVMTGQERGRDVGRTWNNFEGTMPIKNCASQWILRNVYHPPQFPRILY